MIKFLFGHRKNPKDAPRTPSGHQDQIPTTGAQAENLHTAAAIGAARLAASIVHAHQESGPRPRRPDTLAADGPHEASPVCSSSSSAVDSRVGVTQQGPALNSFATSPDTVQQSHVPNPAAAEASRDGSGEVGGPKPPSLITVDSSYKDGGDAVPPAATAVNQASAYEASPQVQQQPTSQLQAGHPASGYLPPPPMYGYMGYQQPWMPPYSQGYMYPPYPPPPGHMYPPPPSMSQTAQMAPPPPPPASQSSPAHQNGQPEPPQQPPAPQSSLPASGTQAQAPEADATAKERDNETDYTTLREDEDRPNGTFTRPPLLITGLEKREYRGWGTGIYVWDSKGKQHNTQIEYRGCNGVFICSNTTCNRLKRPGTGASPKAQLEVEKDDKNKCPIARCKAPLDHIACTARIFFEERKDEDGNTWRHCWYEGFHEHPDPPGGRLTASAKEKLDALVRQNPDASTHERRVGNRAQGIPPLAAIHPSLSSPRKAAYEHEKAKERTGVVTTASGGKGAFPFFEAFRQFQQELGYPFIVDSSMHSGNIYIVMQSPWMANLVREAVRESGAVDVEGGRDGFITDGDHTYFRKGVLLATVIFAPVLECWVPVLFTWILHQDVAHHRPHFRFLFQQVILELKASGRPLTPKDLINVVDFSVSQREAYITEYVEACVSMNPQWDQLQPASQDTERAAFRKTAETALLGCKVHFRRSALRIKKQAHLIPIADAPAFDRFVYKSTSEDITKADFDLLAQEVQTTFPKIKTWLDWWLRPGIASMIFPACSSVDRSLAAKVPGTTNPVEHSHSLLHHAVGSDHDLLHGLMRLSDFVNEPELREASILGGFSKAVAPRTPRKPKTFSSTSQPNDGRAPDTLKTLGVSAADVTVDALSSSPLFLTSYAWSTYSCFIDHTLEVLFWGYALSSEQDQAALIVAVDHDTLLSSMIYHFKRRVTALSLSGSSTAYSQDLMMMQHLVRWRTDNVWEIRDPKGNLGAGGDPTTWFARALNEAREASVSQILAPPQDQPQFFNVCTTLHWECGNGHTHSESDPKDHFVLPIVPEDIKRVSSYLKKDVGAVSVEDYFSYFISRRQFNLLARAPHLVAGKRSCVDEECPSTLSLRQISHIWPNLLFLLPDLLSKHHLQMRHVFTIPLTNDNESVKTDEGVLYRLYARILHHRSTLNSSRTNHFTAELQLGGENVHNGGRLLPSDDPDLLLRPNDNVHVFVFRRVSTAAMTVQAVAPLLKVFGPLAPTGVPHSIDLDALDPPHKPVVSPAPAVVDPAVANVQEQASAPPAAPAVVNASFAGVREQEVAPPADEHSDDSYTIQQELLDIFARKSEPPSRGRRRRQKAVMYSSSSEDDIDLPLLECDDGAQVYLMHIPLECGSEVAEECEVRKEWSGLGGDVVQNEDGTITCLPLSDERDIACSMCNHRFHSYCVISCLRSSGVDEDQLAMIDAGVYDDDSVMCCGDCINGGRWDDECVGLFVLLKHGNWQHYYAAEIISCNIDGLVRLEWFKHNCYLDSDEPPPPTNFVVTQSSCYSALMRPWNRYEVRTASKIKYPIWLHPNAHEQFKYRNPMLQSVLEDAIPFICDVLMGKQHHPIIEIFNAWIQQQINSAQATAAAEGKRLQSRAVQETIATFPEYFFIPILPGDQSLFPQYTDRIHKLVKADLEQQLVVRIPWLYLEVDSVMVISQVLLAVVTAREYLWQGGETDDQIFALAFLPSKFDPIIPGLLQDSGLQDARASHLQRRLTLYEKAYIAGAVPSGTGRIMQVLRYEDTYPLGSTPGIAVSKFCTQIHYDSSLPPPPHNLLQAFSSSGEGEYEFSDRRGAAIRGTQYDFPLSPTPSSKAAAIPSTSIKKVTLLLHSSNAGTAATEQAIAPKKAKKKGKGAAKRSLEKETEVEFVEQREEEGQLRRSKRRKAIQR